MNNDIEKGDRELENFKTRHLSKEDINEYDIISPLSLSSGSKIASSHFEGFDEVDEGIAVPNDESEKNYAYANSKVTAHAMMDLALITANANQLRYILEYQYNKRHYTLTLWLISGSLTLQILVGMFLIFRGKRAFSKHPKKPIDKRIKNIIVFFIFLITIINIFVACFTMTETV